MKKISEFFYLKIFSCLGGEIFYIFDRRVFVIRSNFISATCPDLAL